MISCRVFRVNPWCLRTETLWGFGRFASRPVLPDGFPMFPQTVHISLASNHCFSKVSMVAMPGLRCPMNGLTSRTVGNHPEKGPGRGLADLSSGTM